MTTKTDFHAIMELKKRYTPTCPSFVNASEAELIREVLEISARSNIELQNIRDVAVMLYGKWADSQGQKDNTSAAMQLMDAMSAITYVIDMEKSKQGLPV